MPDTTSQDLVTDPSGGRSVQTDRPARRGGDDGPANKRGAPDKLPVVEPSQPSVGPSTESLEREVRTSSLRSAFAALDRDAVLRRLPAHLRTSTVLHNALPEVLRAVEAEFADAAPRGAPTAAYKTVDAGGNLRDIVPGVEPRRRGDRALLREGVSTTAALTPTAPPSGAAPPVAAPADGRTRQPAGPYGAR